MSFQGCNPHFKFFLITNHAHSFAYIKSNYFIVLSSHEMKYVVLLTECFYWPANTATGTVFTHFRSSLISNESLWHHFYLLLLQLTFKWMVITNHGANLGLLGLFFSTSKCDRVSKFFQPYCPTSTTSSHSRCDEASHRCPGNVFLPPSNVCKCAAAECVSLQFSVHAYKWPIGTTKRQLECDYEPFIVFQNISMTYY